jgi:hypothetical protein
MKPDLKVPTPPPDERRRFPRLPVAEASRQFASRLKTNARWMKHFLHGDK